MQNKIEITGIGTKVSGAICGESSPTLVERVVQKARKTHDDMMSVLAKETESRLMQHATVGTITINVKKVLGHKFSTQANDRILSEYKSWLIGQGFTIDDGNGTDLRRMENTLFGNKLNDPYELKIIWKY